MAENATDPELLIIDSARSAEVIGWALEVAHYTGSVTLACSIAEAEDYLESHDAPLAIGAIVLNACAPKEPLGPPTDGSSWHDIMRLLHERDPHGTIMVVSHSPWSLADYHVDTSAAAKERPVAELTYNATLRIPDVIRALRYSRSQNR